MLIQIELLLKLEETVLVGTWVEIALLLMSVLGRNTQGMNLVKKQRDNLERRMSHKVLTILQLILENLLIRKKLPTVSLLNNLFFIK